MSLVVFRADAGPGIGAGHVMRCLAFAEVLSDMGWSARFVSNAGAAETVPMVRAAGHQLDEIHDDDDPAHIAALLPKAVVVDHYGLAADYERGLAAPGRAVIVFDDLADRPHDCNFLIDPVPDRAATDYASIVSDECSLMLGPRYAMVRPVWRTLRAQSLARLSKEGAVRRIIVSMGSTDPDDVTSRVLSAIGHSGVNAEVDVVLGSGAPHRERVKAALLPQMRLHIDPPGYPSLVAEADLAIGAAGSSSFERAVLGLPSLLVQTAENQMFNIAAFVNAGAANIVPPALLDDPLMFGQFIAALAADLPRRIALSSAAARLTDARGSSRLMAAMAGSVTTALGVSVRLRLVEPEDEDWLLEVQRQTGTRQYFHDPAVPTAEQHRAWMRRTLDDVSVFFAVVEADGQSAGSIRLDRVDDKENLRYEVSIVLDASHRQAGIGAAALALARQVAPGAILDASVLPGNTPSQRLFLGAGYSAVEGNLYRSMPA